MIHASRRATAFDSIDGTIRFTSTGDSAWTSDYSGTTDFDTKTVFVKGTAPDADTLKAKGATHKLRY